MRPPHGPAGMIFGRRPFFSRPASCCLKKNGYLCASARGGLPDRHPGTRPPRADGYLRRRTVRFGFDALRTSQLPRSVGNQATKDAPGVYYIPTVPHPRVGFAGRRPYIFTSAWGFRRCSFRRTGQCEGLQSVERAADRLHVFCSYPAWRKIRQSCWHRGLAGRNFKNNTKIKS